MMLLNPDHWQPWIGPCISHILLIELYLNIHSSYSTQISLGYHIHCKYMHQIKSLRRAKGNKNPKYLACQNAQCCCGDACKSITTLQPQAATVQWSLSCHLPAPFPPYTACALVLRPLPNIMLLPWLTFLHRKVSGTSWAAAGGGNTVRQWYVCKCSYRADFVPWQSLSFNVIKIVPAALTGQICSWVSTHYETGTQSWPLHQLWGGFLRRQLCIVALHTRVLCLNTLRFQEHNYNHSGYLSTRMSNEMWGSQLSASSSAWLIYYSRLIVHYSPVSLQCLSTLKYCTIQYLFSPKKVQI